MDDNRLGNYVRDRRTSLGLTQEAFAELVNETMSQSDISRIERGHITMPSRARMEDLAAALNVTLGELLIGSGWLSADEGDQVDDMPAVVERQQAREAEALLADLAAVQTGLQMLMDRVTAIERSLLQSASTNDDGADLTPGRADQPMGTSLTDRRYMDGDPVASGQGFGHSTESVSQSQHS